MLYTILAYHVEEEVQSWTPQDMCIRAVERAAKAHPPYLETTYRDARNNVA
jgi:hypothetical protein